jgi:hypothetical protein
MRDEPDLGTVGVFLGRQLLHPPRHDPAPQRRVTPDAHTQRLGGNGRHGQASTPGATEESLDIYFSIVFVRQYRYFRMSILITLHGASDSHSSDGACYHIMSCHGSEAGLTCCTSSQVAGPERSAMK